MRVKSSALLVRCDSLGVTSFVRALSLDHRLYEKILHFFRSSAYKTADLKSCWHIIVHRYAPLIRIGGRPLLIGDGCKLHCLSKSMGYRHIQSTLYYYSIVPRLADKKAKTEEGFNEIVPEVWNEKD